jgi:CheY-like chemotaxis protein
VYPSKFAACAIEQIALDLILLNMMMQSMDGYPQWRRLPKHSFHNL